MQALPSFLQNTLAFLHGNTKVPPGGPSRASRVGRWLHEYSVPFRHHYYTTALLQPVCSPERLWNNQLTLRANSAFEYAFSHIRMTSPYNSSYQVLRLSLTVSPNKKGPVGALQLQRHRAKKSLIYNTSSSQTILSRKIGLGSVIQMFNTTVYELSARSYDC